MKSKILDEIKKVFEDNPDIETIGFNMFGADGFEIYEEDFFINGENPSNFLSEEYELVNNYANTLNGIKEEYEEKGYSFEHIDALIKEVEDKRDELYNNSPFTKPTHTLYDLFSSTHKNSNKKDINDRRKLFCYCFGKYPNFKVSHHAVLNRNLEVVDTTEYND